MRKFDSQYMPKRLKSLPRPLVRVIGFGVLLIFWPYAIIVGIGRIIKEHYPEFLDIVAATFGEWK